MSTAPEPAADQAARADVAHLRCLLCYPEWIEGGTYAVCGVLFEIERIAPPDKTRCFVCVDMDQPHFVGHALRGEIPLDDA